MPSNSFVSVSIDAEEATTACCALCLEEKPVSSMCSLSKCSHSSCKDCMVTWIEKVEASGGTHPTCPFCRLELDEDDTTAVLGRNFQPATASNKQVSETDVEIDDLTLQWLQEQTRPCPHCGALIEKEEGCDLMECLCGYRFCYNCGSQGAQCSCTPSNHVFYDNLFRRNAGRDGQVLEESLLEEERALVDLHVRIATRQENERRARVREERKARREREMQEREEVFNDSLNTANWLFHSTESWLKILEQHGQRERVREERMRKRRTWTSRRYRARARESESIHEAFLSGGWLFRVNQHGIEQKIKTLLNGNIVRGKRLSNRQGQERETENCHDALLSGSWLYRVEEQAVDRVLKRLISGGRVRRERRRKSEAKEINEGVYAVLSNGRWLFPHRKLAKALEHLARLTEEEQGRNKRLFERFVTGCGRTNCPNCCKKEKENAINIRLLFLEGDEKVRELTDINAHGL